MIQRLLLFLLLLSGGVVAQEADPASRLGRSVVKISTRNASVAVAGEGSGFFVDPTHVVTNWHVMQEVVEARVIFVDGTFHDVTEVVAADRIWDLMLLKVDIPEGEARPLSLATEPIEGGQKIYLATQGLLEEEYEREEGEPRSFHLREGVGQLEDFEGFELLRSRLNVIEGNSGSPVLDANQEHVVGVASMMQENTDGSVLNTFSIPVSRVRALMEAGGEGVPLIRWQRGRMGSPQYYADLMLVLMESGRTPMAVQVFNSYRAKQEDPSTISREAWSYAGLAHLTLADDLEDEEWEAAMQNAREMFQNAVDTPPRTAFDCIALTGSTYSLGYIAWCFNEYKECKSWFRRTLELDPYDVDAIQVMSMVFAEQWKWDKSEKWRNRLLELLDEDAYLVEELDDWVAECRVAEAEWQEEWEDEGDGGDDGDAPR